MNKIIRKITAFTVAIALTGPATAFTGLKPSSGGMLNANAACETENDTASAFKFVLDMNNNGSGIKAGAALKDHVLNISLNDNSHTIDLRETGSRIFNKYMDYIRQLLDRLSDNENETKQISYRFASKEEGAELMLSNQAYYDGFSQNELEYKMQKKNATMDEYKAFAAEQVRDFTEAEKELLNDQFKKMEKALRDNGYTLPPLEDVVLIKTTMMEELGASGYTHGTQIYMQDTILENATSGSIMNRKMYRDYLDEFLWHELFHCLTRNNPDFREEMYKLIHFTVAEEDFQLPPSEFEWHISNPDVEHHNSYATFRINGEDIDCFMDMATTKHFEHEGDTFFAYMQPVLIPIDGSDTYYPYTMAENFFDILGYNTNYVDDPEECLADNFSYAMVYGMNGNSGNGYETPEIIEGIISYLSR